MLNFLGSKKRLLPWLTEQIIASLDGDEKTFCDVMAGTGTVAREMQNHFIVSANDILSCAFVINKAKLNSKPEGADQYLNTLNKLSGKAGFIYKTYAETRKYFLPHNAKQIDAIRSFLLTDLQESTDLAKNMHLSFYLLASLIEAADKVANCASVYEAYLKGFKSSALNPLILTPLDVSDIPATVYNLSDVDLVKLIDVDIAYVDPPYNHRQFGSNYHVLETIAKYDNPEVKGKTGMRSYEKSRWCLKKQAHLALIEFITNIRARHVFLSYNNEGIMSKDTIEVILSNFGSVTFHETPHRRFKADSERTQKSSSTIEYLFHLRKQT